MITFLDVEASSLDPDSYPIEVGWASVSPNDEISCAAILIKRPANWTDWSPEAEQVHGISRETLTQLGRSPSYVARTLNELFLGETLFCDAPEFDGRWIDRLYEQAGISRSWRLEHADLAFGSVMRWEDRFYLSVALEDTRLHRADADAKVLAEAYCELGRRSRLAAQST